MLGVGRNFDSYKAERKYGKMRIFSRESILGRQMM